MNFLSLGINIAENAYRALTQANAVIGHNVANASTEGYSQQQVNLTENVPLSFYGGAGQVGTGVSLSSVQRIRNIFLDQQIRSQEMDLGKNEVLNDAYNQLKVIFPDAAGVTTSGLNAKINQFFTDFSALSSAMGTATEGAARANVVKDANAMAAQFNTSGSQLNTLVNNLNANISTTVDQVNTYLSEIADLNKTIVVQTGLGQIPNDLMDQRDLIITKLSELINFNEVTLSDNSTLLHINGITLVQEGDAHQLTVTGVNPNHPAFVSIGWKKGDVGITYNLSDLVTGGKLAGYAQSRDEVVRPIQEQLNELASSIITSVNTIHQAGYMKGTTTTNIPFFMGGNSQSMSVNTTIQNDPTGATVLASRTANSTDGDNATLISQLKNFLMNSVTQSKFGINTSVTNQVNPATALSANNGNFLAGNVTGDGLGNGKIVVDGETIDYNIDNDSLDTIIGKINAALTGQVVASFDSTTQKITFIGSKQVIVQDGATGNLASRLDTAIMVTSAANINIEPGVALGRIDPNFALNDTNPPTMAPQALNVTGYNNINFFLTPSASGSFSVNGKTILDTIINGVPVSYTNTDTMQDIVDRINLQATGVTASFDVNTQTFNLSSTRSIQITDITGNLTQFLNLPGDTTPANFYLTIMAGVTSGATDAANRISTSNSAVTQIQSQIDAVSKVNTNEETLKAAELAKTYEAAVRFAATLNEMMNVLINGMGVTNNPPTPPVF